MTSYFYQKRQENFIIRIKRGGEIVALLADFCQKEKVFSGYFVGIGACDQVTLAHYSVEDKKYSEKEFSQPLELTSLSGTIATLNNKPSIHAHAVLADNSFQTISGHLVKGKVSGTAEILVVPLGEKITKSPDKETGLNLLDL